MFNDEAEYAYAVGVVRSLETKLLARDQIEAMLMANDIEGVLKVLGETEYAHYIADVSRGEDYEVALVRRLKDLLKLLSRLSLDAALTDLFLLRYDLHNLKIILKTKVTEEDIDGFHPLFLDLGKVPIERLKKTIFEESYSELYPLLKVSAIEALSVFERTEDLQTIDIILDRRFYPLFTKKAEESGSPYLKRYFEMVIDLININTLVRIKWQMGKANGLESALLDNGSLPKGFYTSIFDSPWDAISPKFFSTPYDGVVESGIAHLTNYNSFDRFESLRDNFLTTYLKRARLFTFGIEPLVAYFFIKEREIEIVRMIMMARLNGLSVEGIRERLFS